MRLLKDFSIADVVRFDNDSTLLDNSICYFKCCKPFNGSTPGKYAVFHVNSGIASAYTVSVTTTDSSNTLHVVDKGTNKCTAVPYEVIGDAPVLVCSKFTDVVLGDLKLNAYPSGFTVTNNGIVILRFGTIDSSATVVSRAITKYDINGIMIYVRSESKFYQVDVSYDGDEEVISLVEKGQLLMVYNAIDLNTINPSTSHGFGDFLTATTDSNTPINSYMIEEKNRYFRRGRNDYAGKHFVNIKFHDLNNDYASPDLWLPEATNDARRGFLEYHSYDVGFVYEDMFIDKVSSLFRISEVYRLLLSVEQKEVENLISTFPKI